MRQDLLDRYAASLPSTRPGQKIGWARKFLEWVGGRELSAANVRDYYQSLRDDGYAPGTVLQNHKILHRLFVVCGLEFPLNRGETPVVSERDVLNYRLATHDIESMIRVARDMGPEHRCFLALSTVYGLRRVEMVGMIPQSLDVKSGLIFVETAKHGRQRYHLIPPEILPYLTEWGFRYRVSEARMTQLFIELRKAIGLDVPYLNWHAIRRQLTRLLWEARFTLPEINEFMRWKSGSSGMAVHYGASKEIGTSTDLTQLGQEEQRLDEKIFARHPLLPLWRNNGTTLV